MAWDGKFKYTVILFKRKSRCLDTKTSICYRINTVAACLETKLLPTAILSNSWKYQEDDVEGTH